MEKINYKAMRANAEQMEWVLNKHWENPEERQKARERFNIIFVAIDENENIIGRLIIEEKKVPPPLNGTDWWINNLFTLPEFRRQGIASAMLKETIKHAEQSNIRHLQGSASPTLQASMFWFNHNFCVSKYGQKSDDGNYPHMIFYRIDRNVKENQKDQNGCHIIKADKEQINYIFDEYIVNINPEYFKDKRDDIFGYAAVDENKKMIGFITSWADDLGLPLSGVQWWTRIFVFPEMRRRGIGSVLLKEMIKFTKESNVTQLLCAYQNDEASGFWYNNNFDMFYWSAVGVNNTLITAGLRIL